MPTFNQNEAYFQAFSQIEIQIVQKSISLRPRPRHCVVFLNSEANESKLNASAQCMCVYAGIRKLHSD